MKFASLSLIVASTVAVWLHQTEMGAEVRSRPAAETARTMLASLSDLALGRVQKHPPASALIEPMAQFLPDEPMWQRASAVGMLAATFASEPDYVYSCTATAIAADLILTNAHCVDAARHDGTDLIKVVFYQGYIKGQDAVTFTVELQPVEINTKLDFAILQLGSSTDGTPPNVLAAAKAREAIEGERLVIFHHSKSAGLQITRTACRQLPELARDPSRLTHSCATFVGSSGSLIIAERDDAILGLHHSVSIDPDKIEGYGSKIITLLDNSPTLRRIFTRR